ncbi:MAG: hypothetical protein UV67_C0028G0006 [Parcubacteria group bacterium GW2011_GWC1_43_12]|nr:MAG: hypothetical protein UV67_C0028G0006 [Parcubacteria group bacterium GW2011_GWC1_43_12]
MLSYFEIWVILKLELSSGCVIPFQNGRKNQPSKSRKAKESSEGWYPRSGSYPDLA